MPLYCDVSVLMFPPYVVQVDHHFYLSQIVVVIEGYEVY
jgi:hypothetical protein